MPTNLFIEAINRIHQKRFMNITSSSSYPSYNKVDYVDKQNMIISLKKEDVSSDIKVSDSRKQINTDCGIGCNLNILV